MLQGENHKCIGYLSPIITAMTKKMNELSNLNYCRLLVIALKNGLNKR